MGRSRSSGSGSEVVPVESESLLVVDMPLDDSEVPELSEPVSSVVESGGFGSVSMPEVELLEPESEVVEVCVGDVLGEVPAGELSEVPSSSPESVESPSSIPSLLVGDISANTPVLQAEPLGTRPIITERI